MKRIAFCLLGVTLLASSAAAQAPYFKGKALKNPDLVADAKKQGLEPELIPGEEVEAMAKEVMGQPPDVIEAMTKVMGG